MKGEELASGAAHADNVSPALLGGFTLVRCGKNPMLFPFLLLPNYTQLLFIQKLNCELLMHVRF